MHIIGRKAELQQLDEYMQSGKAEFVALYGRRRVGKTYLVEEYYNHRFAFNVTGVIDGTRSEQMILLHLRPSVESITGESMESNCSIIEKIPPKGVSFSDFICTFAMSCYDFCLF